MYYRRESVLQDPIKTKFAEKLSSIVEQFPVYGKRNLIFLTDISAVPFGWSIKEYMRLKYHENSKFSVLSKKQIPQFFRIDVSPFKYQADFVKEYIFTADEETRQKISEKHAKLNLIKDNFAYNCHLISQILPEKIQYSIKYRELFRMIKNRDIISKLDLERYLQDKPASFVQEIDNIYKVEYETGYNNRVKSDKHRLEKRGNLAKNMYGKIYRFLSPLSEMLSQSTITIFDETLPNQVIIYDGADVQGYEFKRTVSLVRFILDLVCKHLKVSPRWYAAGIDESDTPWNEGMIGNEEEFNQIIVKKLASPTLYSVFVTPIGRYKAELRKPRPNIDRLEVTYAGDTLATMLPRQAQEVPKLLIQEMKDMGRIIYKMKK